MRTFEGIMCVKEYINDSGKKTPLTIDCLNKSELKIEIERIKKAFLIDGAYKVRIEVRELK